MKNKIYFFNKAEGVFFPAFDKYLCNDSQISMDSGKIERMWDTISFSGGKCFTIHWQGETELGRYDSFRCFLSAPPHARATGTAMVDGQKVTLFENAQGDTFPVEWTGKLPDGENRVLTDVFLEFTFEAEHNAIALSWLGLADSGLEAEAQVPRWQEAWCEMIHAGRAGEIEKNLILTQEEGERLRKVFAEDESLAAVLRENAEKALAVRVEDQMREYAPVTTNLYRFVRVRDRGRVPMENLILNLAVAGYLLKEPSYSYHAAKLIVAMLVMKWYEGPVCGMEGSKFHHVCFTEDHMVTEISLAMGFLGGIFTEEGIRQIVDKVEENWKFVCSKALEPGYRNYMNQGLVGNRGVMVGAAFLQLWKGGYEDAMQAAYERHTALVGNYLTENGHGTEGPGYFEYTFTTSIQLWHVYAKMTCVSVDEVVPESFKRAGRYLAAMMAEGDRAGTRIPVNCTASPKVSLLLLMFMTAVCDFPEGNNYLLARFAKGETEKEENSFQLLFCEYYKLQAEPYFYSRPVKEEISFEKEGLLTYRQGSTKLMVLAERNPLTGHFHEDRGCVVLETEGEVLLPELGTACYTNPTCLLMSKKEYHNLACPADLTMLAESEIGQKAAAQAAYPIVEELRLEDMAMPEAKVLYHRQESDRYTFAVDTGMLFGENITGIRSGCLEQGSLVLEDDWSFEEAHPLMVTFLSYKPWEINRIEGTAVSGRKKLKVTSRGDWQFQTEDGMVDYKLTPVYVLRVLVEAATEHSVRSEICWNRRTLSPDNTGRENALILQEMLNEGGTIRIEEPGIYEIEDTLIIGSHTKLSFGAGVFLKRASSSIGSFAIINRGAYTRTYDEDIMIEGLHLITNGVEARYHAAVYGLTGELSFFYVKNLRIIDFTCMDLPRLSFGIHVCTFEDLVIDRIHVEGRKDAVHLGTGSKFVIRHGLFRTFDDPIALNAHDYAVANPQMGWIEDGLIEDCYDLADKDTTGYFCRILAGAWVDWYEGMEIQNSDTVVSNGRVYRAFQRPDGIKYKSMTPPSHKEGMETLEGIHWVMVQEEVTYQCGCRNIHFKDIHLQKEREKALSIHFDHDRYSRSVYPGAQMPIQQNLVFENLIIQNKVECLVRSITPVDTIKVINSVIGDSNILLESLPEEDVAYPKTQVLLMGNTFSAEGENVLVRCEEGCCCQLKVLGSLVQSEDYHAVIEGNVDVAGADVPFCQR